METMEMLNIVRLESTLFEKKNIGQQWNKQQKRDPNLNFC
jgi:hypothetical protein